MYRPVGPGGGCIDQRDQEGMYRPVGPGGVCIDQRDQEGDV